MVSHHLAKFSCHKDCGNVDIMISVCHVILQNHVIKSLYDFMGGSPHGKSPLCLVWWPWALW